MRIILLAVLILATSCAAFQPLAYFAPPARLDQPRNLPLPSDDSKLAKETVNKWRKLSRSEFPTPYHVYVDTPLPGTFEGERVTAIAFSGGGSRAAVFGALCVKELEQFGRFSAISGGNSTEIRLLDEIDYISGISGGSFPATGLALSFSDNKSIANQFELALWPNNLNKSLHYRALRKLIQNPFLFARDGLFVFNLRPHIIKALDDAYFGSGNGISRRSLTFADLPSSPVLFLGSVVITDPSSPYLQTRLPYLYSFYQEPDFPWNYTVRTFETFHTDPMTHPLSDAIYNSASFPGVLRSGLVRMYEDPSWIFSPPDDLSLAKSRFNAETIMPDSADLANSRAVYETKDGGLWDNRGTAVLFKMLSKLPSKHSKLIISCDASPRGLGSTSVPPSFPQTNWLRELIKTTQFTWDVGQVSMDRNVLQAANDDDDLLKNSDFKEVSVVKLGFTELLSDLYNSSGLDQYQQELIDILFPDESDTIKTKKELLMVMQSITTHLGKLNEKQVLALHMCAWYSVQRNMPTIEKWIKSSAPESTRIINEGPPPELANPRLGLAHDTTNSD